MKNIIALHLRYFLHKLVDLVPIFKRLLSLDLPGHSTFQICHIKILSFSHQVTPNSENQ